MGGGAKGSVFVVEVDFGTLCFSIVRQKGAICFEEEL